MILTNDPEIAKKINRSVFPGIQGGPLMHVIAAKAVAFGEALKPEFRDYQQRIVNNAKALADSLLENDVRLVTGGTDNHLMLIDLNDSDCSGRTLESRLDSVHITVNKNKIPGDRRTAMETSGIRVGTPAVTSRGFDEADMRLVGKLIADSIHDYEGTKAATEKAVRELCLNHPIYE